MAVSNDVWQTARTIWENTPVITWRELAEKLASMFDEETPSYSALSRRAKKQQWKKTGIPKRNKHSTNATSDDENSPQSLENNKETNHATAIVVATKNTQQKIDDELNNLVLTAQQKREIIDKHRQRLKNLGDLQDNTIATVNILSNLDMKTQGEEIQRVIIVSESLSRTLNQLTNSQKVIGEQEFMVCGITVDDFKESERDKRKASLDALAELNELEAGRREQLDFELQQRLQKFEAIGESGDFGALVDDD